MGLDQGLYRRYKHMRKHDEAQLVLQFRNNTDVRDWMEEFTGFNWKTMNCVDHVLTKKQVIDFLNFYYGYMWGSRKLSQDLEDELNNIVDDTDWDEEEIYYMEWY